MSCLTLLFLSMLNPLNKKFEKIKNMLKNVKKGSVLVINIFFRFNTFASRLIQAVRVKTPGLHMVLHENFSGPEAL